MCLFSCFHAAALNEHYCTRAERKLLYCSEIQQLSEGKVLACASELNIAINEFLLQQNHTDVVANFSDYVWFIKQT